MSKYLVVAALVGLAGCAAKPQQAPADSTAAAAPAPVSAPAAGADSTVKVAGDTAKNPSAKPD
jgi:uncharacterized lipoprotein YmbA